jgi:phage baseplate assembly protein W
VPSEPAKDFLGVGWRFPVEATGGGDIATASHEEDVREAVRIILETSPGERAMRPDWGAGLNALTFEPMNAATFALARHRVEQALIQWEPRIDSITVEVTADPPLGRLLIEIEYRIRATNTFYNFVYPFYLREARSS